ncbi:MAG: SAM-dependent methyltransferase [Kiritimatiellae bacterium]|nr:SAM-dependent methyltransferase [Kiritimatiellia bacterium]
MEKFELEPALCEEIRAKVFGADFMKLVQTVRRGGATFKISLRPVAIGGERRFQAEMVEDGQVQVRNFGEAGAREGLEEIIAQKGARDLHLICGSGDLHVRVTRKGRAAVSRSAKLERKVELKPHDRVKNVPLNAFDAAALLRVLGIADGEGRIRASMRGKYDQVNEFLKAVGETVKVADKERPFVVVDCGCGKAYLTLALYFYLTQIVGLANVKVYGIDRRGDVIAAARRMAAQLDLEGKVEFIEADLEAAKLDRADLVVSLHACDTATDEALARAVEWGGRLRTLGALLPARTPAAYGQIGELHVRRTVAPIHLARALLRSLDRQFPRHDHAHPRLPRASGGIRLVRGHYAQHFDPLRAGAQVRPTGAGRRVSEPARLLAGGAVARGTAPKNPRQISRPLLPNSGKYGIISFNT